MVKKEPRQDDYFNQQSILLTLPANTSPLIISTCSTYVGCYVTSHALSIEIIIVPLFFFNHCHFYIAVYFLEVLINVWTCPGKPEDERRFYICGSGFARLNNYFERYVKGSYQ